MTERHKKALYAAAIAIFILFTLAVSWFVGRPLIRFVRQPEQFRAWVDGHGAWGPLAYAAMVFLQVLVACNILFADDYSTIYAGVCQTLSDKLSAGLKNFQFI